MSLTTDLDLLADWCRTAFADDDPRKRPLVHAVESLVNEAARLEWQAGERRLPQYEREPSPVADAVRGVLANVVPMVRKEAR